MRKEDQKVIIIGVIIVVFGFLYFSLQWDYQKRYAQESRNARTQVVAVATDTPMIADSLAEGRKRTGSLMAGSVERGTFAVTELAGLKTRVNVFLLDANTSSAAYVYGGTCEDLGRVTYDLNGVIGGRSETVLAVDFDSIVHAEKGSAIVALSACGDIK